MEQEPPLPTEPRLRFRLLGPLEVTRDGTALDLGPPKQRAALAALLVADGRIVSTDRLIEAVWGDDPPARALANIQVYISRLRSLLHSDDARGLIRRPPGYVISAEWVDVTEFRRLTAEAAAHVRSKAWAEAAAAAGAAIRLWRGPFLDDLGDEQWVSTEAPHLDELYAQCMEAWVTGLLGLGGIGEAITRSQTMIEAYPLREQCWWLRMIALHRNGRSPEALDAFGTFAGNLDEQLGLEPGPSLRTLQTAILRHDPAIASWPNDPSVRRPEPPLSTAADVSPESADAPAVDTPAAVRRPAQGNTDIVGRDEELATLDRLLDEVVDGGYRWALLTGRAGMGKTRLATEASTRARQRGITVLWTSCPDDVGTPSWWPLRSLVSDMGSDPDDVFLPPSGADADTIRFVVYERLSRLLGAASADGPLLVVIDDAQWLDAASVRGLSYLAQTQRFRHLGIVLTVRDQERRPDFDRVLSTLSRAPVVVHVPVDALDGPSSSALLRQVAGDTINAADAFTLVHRIGGNPLLLTEYARLPAEERRDGDIPLAARGLLERRLHGLPDGVVAVLGAAGVIGETFELDLLAEVTGLDLLDLIERLDSAVAESIIDPATSGVGYQFHHGLVRDAVIAQLTVLRRQGLHARVAQALRARGGDARTLIRRATHLSAAMPIVGPAPVVEACAEAARAAENVWDWDVAAQQWEAALTAHRVVPDADPRVADDLLLARLDVLSRTSRTEKAWEVAGVALDEATATDRSATIGRLAHGLVRSGGYWPFVYLGSDPGPLVRRIEAALAVVGDDTTARALLLTVLAVANSYSPQQNTTDAMSREAVALAENLGDQDVLADALIGRLTLLAATRPSLSEYAQILDRLHGLSHADAATDAVLEDCHRIRLASFRGDLGEVAERLQHGVMGADRLRLTRLRVHFRWVEAMTAQWQGDLDRAETLARIAHESHQQFESTTADISYSVSRLLIRWHRGDLHDHPAEVVGASEPMLWKALVAAEVGDTAVGRDLLAQQLPWAGPELWPSLTVRALLAHAAADLGMVEAAAPLLDWLTPRTDLFVTLGPFGVIGPVALCTGRLHALLGEHELARRDLVAAEQMCRASGNATGLMRTRLALLELEPPGRDRSEALRGVAEEARRIGMTAVARAADRWVDQKFGRPAG